MKLMEALLRLLVEAATVQCSIGLARLDDLLQLSAVLIGNGSGLDLGRPAAHPRELGTNHQPKASSRHMGFPMYQTRGVMQGQLRAALSTPCTWTTRAGGSSLQATIPMYVYGQYLASGRRERTAQLRRMPCWPPSPWTPTTSMLQGCLSAAETHTSPLVSLCPAGRCHSRPDDFLPYCPPRFPLSFRFMMLCEARGELPFVWSNPLLL